MAATLKRQRLKKLILEDQGKTSTRQLMLRAGYSQSMADNPKQVIGQKDFKTFLDSLDDRVFVKRWYMWATEDTDKRVAVEVGDKILRLKDRYPASKLKLTAYQEEITALQE